MTVCVCLPCGKPNSWSEGPDELTVLVSFCCLGSMRVSQVGTQQKEHLQRKSGLSGEGKRVKLEMFQITSYTFWLKLQ